ncbi:MAG: tetratricopeptide repeat protein [bacterium]|nr:tetratricopeptide repeat protein [bacterium]MDY4098965.1 tetratricopeptide repeat protein [Lachnospiraceae bacterium]
MTENRQTMNEWNRKISKETKQKHGRRALVAALLFGTALMMSGCGQQRTENAQAYRKIGINAMAEGDYEEAIKNFQLALDQSRGQIRNLELDICMQKAEALYLNGQPEEAAAVCDAVLDYDKSYANAYYLRGNLYLQQGDEKKALADYEQAAKYADADYEIYIQLYENLNRAGKRSEGEVYLTKALELKGKGRYHLTNRGYIYFLMGDYGKAKEQLLQAVAIEQKEGADDKAELYLAQTAEKLGDGETAEKYYQAYARNHADDSIVLEELGNMALEKKDYVEACAYYQKGLQTMNPVNEQLLRRGEIAALEQLYNFEEAKTKMAQYVLDYPEDEEAAREYLFLKTRTAVADQIAEEEQAAQAQAAEEAAQSAEEAAQEEESAQQ